MNNIEKILSEKMKPKQMKKLRGILDKVYFFSIATSMGNQPQATMIQPVLYKDWSIVFISDKKTKKVRNLEKNPHTWLIADATGIFHIPKVIYIKGTATVEQLTENKFEEFLTHHGPLSTRVFRSLMKDGVDKSVLVTVRPSKFITIGIFGKMNEQLSFDLME